MRPIIQIAHVFFFCLGFCVSQWFNVFPQFSDLMYVGLNKSRGQIRKPNSTLRVRPPVMIKPDVEIDFENSKPSALAGCGQICRTDIPGTPSKFFDFIRKDVECKNIWSNPEIDQERDGPPLALSDLPADMAANFTYDSRLPMVPYVSLMDQKYLGSAASTPVWEENTVNEWALQCARGLLEGNYGRTETSFLLSGLLQVPDLPNAKVLVIGSENPWVEACILSTGVSDVTTLEYGRIDSRHPSLHTITPHEMRAKFSDYSEAFDVIVTFSSVEHAGLGRYGDKLNPWGDRQAIARAWCATKPGGYLVIGVPFGQDAIEYNAHRIYGNIMYPHLVSNWYQQWRADAGDQRVHVLRKSIDGLTDPGHVPPPRALCLVGALYGQTNNQILAISWARMLARRDNLSLVLTFQDGSQYLFENWAKTFGVVPGVSWGSSDRISDCEKTMTWEDAFIAMLGQRASVSDSEWPLITPASSVRNQALEMWTRLEKEYGSYMTVHGRSFENSMAHCLSTGHSGYPCPGEHLCDYRLNVVLDRFRSFLNETVDPRQIVLFTDGQNPEYASDYPVIEHTGNLFVHMWVMVMSKIHIAHPGSTVDYVIWRWRQQEGPDSGIMLPWVCYNNVQYRDGESVHAR